MSPAHRPKRTRNESRALSTERSCKRRISSLAALDGQRSLPKVSNGRMRRRKGRSRSPTRTPIVEQSPLSVFDPTIALNKEAHYVSICITPNIDGKRKDQCQILLGVDLNDLHRDDLEKLQSSFYDNYVKEWEHNHELEGSKRPTTLYWSAQIGNPEGNHLAIRVKDQKSWELVEANLRRMKRSGYWRHCNTLFVEAFFEIVDRSTTPDILDSGKRKGKVQTVQPVTTFVSDPPSYAPPPQPSSPMQITDENDLMRRSGELLLQRELQKDVIRNGVVYEMTVVGLNKVRRRVEDGRVDIYQLVRATGDMNQAERKIFKSAITVVGGTYAGTWIKAEKAWEICQTRGVAKFLRPLLEYNSDQLESMVSGKVSGIQFDSVAVDIYGLVNQIQSERRQLEIPRAKKLDVDTVSGKCVYQCRLSDCKMQFMDKVQLRVIKT